MSFAEVGYRFRYMEWAKTVMESGLPGVIDVGSSGVAPVTLRELGIRLSDLELFGPHYYGEPELRRRIARHARVAEDRVLPTLGASHAHFLICASLIEPGDEVIVEVPGYEALSAVPRALGARVRELRRPFEDGFQFDPDHLRRLLTRRTRLVLVTNLHNPSGVALAPECLAALAECAGGESPSSLSDPARLSSSVRLSSPAGPCTARHSGPVRHSTPARLSDPARLSSPARLSDPARLSSPARLSGPSLRSARQLGAGEPAEEAGAETGAFPRGPWVVVNEVYRDLVRRDPPRTGHALGPRAVSLGSLTKVYGLGETRVGWAIADPRLVLRASRVNDFGVVNGPYIAERIGALALARRAKLLARSRAIVSRNRRVLESFLRRTPRLERVATSGSHICFPRVRKVADTEAFARSALVRHKVCVVPGEFFGAAGHVRIGIGTRDSHRLEEGLRRLEEAIREAGPR